MENNQPPSSPIDGITLNSFVTLSDYRKFAFAAAYFHPIFIFLNLIGTILLVVFISKGDWAWYTIVILIFLVSFPFILLWGATKAYKSRKIPHEKMSYTFTDERIICEGFNYYADIKWEHLTGAREIRKHFLLYAPEGRFLMIAKHGFASEHDMRWLREKLDPYV